MVMPQLDGAQWRMASRKLITVRYLTALITWLVIGAGLTVLYVLVGGWTVWLFVPFAVAVLINTWVPYRQVTAHGWAEREDDLVIARGRMFRTTTVVPYGRMQYVEVAQGPLLRAFGLATLQLHTASPSTYATVSGMPMADAERLRDRLMSRGEAKMAGL